MPTHDLKDLAALVRAGTPLILIETPEEPRVVELFRGLIAELFRPLYRWTITTGLVRLDLDLEQEERGGPRAGAGEVHRGWAPGGGERARQSNRGRPDRSSGRPARV